MVKRRASYLFIRICLLIFSDFQLVYKYDLYFFWSLVYSQNVIFVFIKICSLPNVLISSRTCGLIFVNICSITILYKVYKVYTLDKSCLGLSSEKVDVCSFLQTERVICKLICQSESRILNLLKPDRSSIDSDKAIKQTEVQ